ncbi:MAG TPA: chemotaxis protein CheA [Actinomycetes bacterium]|nr:chemotaxis protein CheA [Actinomycetes bacterium]
MEDLDEIIAEFLVESHENLDQLDSDLVALEQDPASRQLLGSIFRTIHTIKGTTGFLEFGHLEALTHAGESLLSKLRDGELRLTAEITDALLTMVDAIRSLLAAIEATGQEGEPDHGALIATLTRLRQGGTAGPAAPSEPPQPRIPSSPPVGEIIVEHGGATPDDVSFAMTAQDVGDTRPIGEILVGQGSTTSGEVSLALEVQTERRSVADGSIRVEVERLDLLMRLMGELVLTRNQSVAHAAVSGDATMIRASTRLNVITRELQDVVLQMRMQPIDTLWNKLPRVVRDLSATCGKTVRLEMEGRETELDKTILEAVKDPLTHLVRNAVDHGIEPPEGRLAAGKEEQGLLLLRAFHEGGQVNIEIRDDGAGMDPSLIAAKALERGLVDAEQLARMNEREITNLIFLPGFSTASSVTNVSGRGVGMDVVKSNLEKIGGSVDVSSVVGAGTTFHVKIPLTLAIIPALTVVCAGDRYAIPTVNLAQLVRLEGEQGRASIELVSETPVYRLRGKLLPLVYLDRELGVSEPDSGERDRVLIAVLQVEDRRFGLVVDDILDTQEIVVKPLSSQLESIPVYAGATILGDGSVALILDIPALAQRANVLRAGRELARGAADHTDDDRPETRETLLVASVGQDRRIAIPLALVTRLEEFPAASIEHVGSRALVQYRDEILPLVHLAPVLEGAGMRGEDDVLAVVVCVTRGRSVGLVVDAILDIVEGGPPGRADLVGVGPIGTAVVQDRITELLDVEQSVRAADPRFYDAPTVPAGSRS